MSGRETTPYWQAERKLKAYPPLGSNQDCDGLWYKLIAESHRAATEEKWVKVTSNNERI